MRCVDTGGSHAQHSECGDRLTVEHAADRNEVVVEDNEVVVEDEVLEERPGGVGTTFRTLTQERGKRMESRGVVTRHDPPKRHAVRLTGQMIDIEAEYLFENLSGRTRVTQGSEVFAKRLLRHLMPLFGWAVRKSTRKAQEAELNSLKRFCAQPPN